MTWFLVVAVIVCALAWNAYDLSRTHAGVPNMAPPWYWLRLLELRWKQWQTQARIPGIHRTSAYRADYDGGTNELVGGQPNSAHTHAGAEDFQYDDDELNSDEDAINELGDRIEAQGIWSYVLREPSKRHVHVEA